MPNGTKDAEGHWLLPRGYPDIVRPDSSQELQKHQRAFWGVGEQLWDVDFLNNFRYFNYYQTIVVDNWFTPWRPGSSYPLQYSYVAREGEFNDYIFDVFNPEPPIVGHTYSNKVYTGQIIYSKCDREFLVYSGTRFIPIKRMPLWQNSIEINIDCQGGLASGRVFARYNVVKSFHINRNMLGYCRAFGPPAQKPLPAPLYPPWRIFKNGEAVIGAFTYRPPSEGIHFSFLDNGMSDLLFEEGDELSIAAGATNGGAHATFTLFGQYL